MEQQKKKNSQKRQKRNRFKYDIMLMRLFSSMPDAQYTYDLHFPFFRSEYASLEIQRVKLFAIKFFHFNQRYLSSLFPFNSQNRQFIFSLSLQSEPIVFMFEWWKLVTDSIHNATVTSSLFVKQAKN